MMKRILALVLAIILCLSVFTGCSKKKKSSSQDSGSLFGTEATTEALPEPSTEETTEAPVETTEAPTEETTEAPTEPPTEATTEPPTEPPTTVPTEPEFESYYLEIGAGQPIYSGPGGNSHFVATVEKSGIYTIVEEETDRNGDVWGRLKSGVGWVNVTEITYKAQNPDPVTLDYADSYTLIHADYDMVIVHDSEYAVDIIFRAKEDLRNVTLFGTEYNDEYGWETSREYCHLARLTPDKPLVVRIEFWDMTTYHFAFEDAFGNYHIYEIYMSGKDGSLVFHEI